MVYLTYIVAGVILLGVCIFIHELGHLLGGKMVGIKAKTFSIGMGKGIIKKKIGDTTYQIAPIPLGGFCQFYGEDPSEQRTGQQFEFLSAHPLKRIVTVVMGPLFNLLFGILVFFVMGLIGYTKDAPKIFIPENMQSGKLVSPAFSAGLRTGDRIVKIGEREVQSFADIQTSVLFSEGKKLEIAFRRDDRVLSAPVPPRRLENGRYEIGVMPYGKKILVIDELIEGEAAQAAGLREKDEVISLDGVAMKEGGDVTNYIQSHANKPILVKVQRRGEVIEKKLVPQEAEIIKFQTTGGKGTEQETIPLIQSRNLKRFLEKGLLKINNEKVATYDELAKTVRNYGKKRIELQLGDEKYAGYARMEKVGFVGFGIVPSIIPDQVEVKYGVGEAMERSVTEPYYFIVMNLKGLGMLISGKMNVRENLSGPIRIVQLAGFVAYNKGIPDFIILMAQISIILMVMNLLPIPLVDGSQIVFFLVEMVRRKPMSQKVMERIQTVGLAFLILLGAFVIVNDISMLPLMQKFLR